MPRELDVPPIITSSKIKSKSLVGSRKTLRVELNVFFPFALAVAPEVWPVTVSPFVNEVGYEPTAVK